MTKRNSPLAVSISALRSYSKWMGSGSFERSLLKTSSIVNLLKSGKNVNIAAYYPSNPGCFSNITFGSLESLHLKYRTKSLFGLKPKAFQTKRNCLVIRWLVNARPNNMCRTHYKLHTQSPCEYPSLNHPFVSLSIWIYISDSWVLFLKVTRSISWGQCWRYCKLPKLIKCDFKML